MERLFNFLPTSGIIALSRNGGESKQAHIIIINKALYLLL